MGLRDLHTRYIKNTRKQAFAALAIVSIYIAALAFLHSKPVRRASNDSLAAVAAIVDKAPQTISAPAKTTDCHTRGPLPDPGCTPGAVFSDATAADICRDGYSATVRDVPISLKKRIYKAYGIAYPQPFGTYELDHLIPLSIGGSNDAANLFPEARGPLLGFQQKDIAENYLHIQVCSGALDIGAAERAIARDWVGIYDGISEADREALNAQYKSWADKGPY